MSTLTKINFILGEHAICCMKEGQSTIFKLFLVLFLSYAGNAMNIDEFIWQPMRMKVII
jgi:hypothetical protein